MQVVRREDRGRRVRLRHPRRRPSSIPEELVPLRADRPDGARPQPGQLLRRDRAGRLPSRPTSCRASTSQRSAAAGPAVLLPRHAAARGSAARTSTSSRSTGRSARCTTSSATATCGWRSPKGRVALRAEQRSAAGRRRARTPSAASRRSPARDRRRRSVRERAETLRRPLQPGAAVLSLDDRARAAPHRSARSRSS